MYKAKKEGFYTPFKTMKNKQTTLTKSKYLIY